MGRIARTLCINCVPFVALLVVTGSAPGQSGIGVPDDWTHHRLVFSNPGTFADAANKGRLEKWSNIVSEPRFRIQQWKRLASFNRDHDHDRDDRQHRSPAELKTDWSMDMGTGATVGAGQYPAKYNFSTTTATCSDWVAYNTGVAGVSAGQANVVAYSNLYDTTCSNPVPNQNWAYFSGTGKALTSIAVSLDGSKIAYVENPTSGAATLRILQWHAGQGTPSAAHTPDHVFTNTTAGHLGNTAWNVTNCPAAQSCMINVAFQNGDSDSNSAPFYIYDGSDTLYVGDNSGKLHKFTGVFTGTPGEVTTGGWPISVSANILTSPVYDSATGNIFVADSGGFLYSYKATTAAQVMVSSKLSSVTGTGIADAPLVDSTAGQVYVFVGDDANTSAALACDSANGCSGVFQFATTNATTGTGACVATSAAAWSGNNCGLEALFGSAIPTSQTIYGGAFDHIYEVSAAGTAGNLWACSEHQPASGAAGPRLNYVPIQANGSVVTSGIYSSAQKPIASITSNTTNTPCSPVTEIWNSANANDYIFLSVTANGALTTTNASAPCTGACLYNFIIATGGTATTAGTLTAPSTAQAGIVTTAGSSGIVIDNTLGNTGESQIYYTPLGNQPCTGSTAPVSGNNTGGCAIQTSQVTP